MRQRNADLTANLDALNEKAISLQNDKSNLQAELEGLREEQALLTLRWESHVSEASKVEAQVEEEAQELLQRWLYTDLLAVWRSPAT